ncbi:SNAP protein (soluble N-ethylmaleimide-sensitive factor attachment protein), putative [Plasmodium knowlesi strain H]|uniref:SNAP protein (Soluble N-ethylmaleimide-sensitive factor attachment protein), putative n=3 Tax=Plasmodium knowlesi TaxID=5850 RepID=A0A5K1VTT5_PLAKH|nr:alpha-soluble NSF attachment protein, putative [Plasmodium knowlesi strain H]OTN67103.1 putative SNAP protein (Soluble N-ethylmaleimide-sensitive factor attachment protein) [Plasmodium knowlesi]CAA9988750.1 alpha-soluble NSF attachment protein, putative [Plasmodium knowlesi strain H]SBO21700.1 SNAP protein (soluble N-ethylmaleimide-sensitive factor attachment protein), putative [Plasmodium knowlesi strain H]SBO22078.1 SNAP protein (soluble N-ethylmaleimide-sensitive factor attachment protein|eukprot:XP_002259726.1 snap protein (soluble n-ethylmaleimide-sensitive factor attachment protein), putative [Plasmodium knowlesi strain H]
MEYEARELEKKAEQLNKKGFLSSFFGGDNTDEMINCYNLAANKYKLCHKWKEATACILKNAILHRNNNETSYCANAYLEAGNIAKKYDKMEAIKHIEEAVNMYAAIGRFSNCGKCEKNIAEIYEDLYEYGNASKYYKKAAYYFEMDEYSKSAYTQCIVKYAELSSQYSGQYEEAISIFENEAEKALKSTLLQYGARDYYIKAGILHIVLGDLVNAKISIDKYCMNDPRFLSSREKKFLDNIMEAVTEQDVEYFEEAVHEYDRITKLDNWKVHFLYQIKSKMNAEPNVELTADGAVDLT